MKKEIIISIGLVIGTVILYLLAINAATLFLHNLFLIIALIVLVVDLIHIIMMIKTYRDER